MKIPPLRTNGREYSKETMKQYLCCTDERKSHTQAKKTTRVGNVRCFGNLFIFLKPLGIRIFYENVEHDKVISGIIEDRFLQWTFFAGTIFNKIPRKRPNIVFAKHISAHSRQRTQFCTNVWIFMLQRFSLWPFTLLKQSMQKIKLLFVFLY